MAPSSYGAMATELLVTTDWAVSQGECVECSDQAHHRFVAIHTLGPLTTVDSDLLCPACVARLDMGEHQREGFVRALRTFHGLPDATDDWGLAVGPLGSDDAA